NLRPKMLFSPDSATLVVLYENEGIEVWDVATGKQRLGDFEQLKNWSGDKANFFALGSFSFVTFSPDSTFLALTSNTPDGPRFGVWDLSLAKLLWLRKLDNPNCGVSFTSDSRFIVGDPQGENQFEVLEAQTGKIHRPFIGKNLHASLLPEY